MERPRWHDALIVLGVVALLLVGGWALWWEDVRSLVWPSKPAVAPAPPAAGQT